MGNGGLNFGKIYALCANFFIIINIYKKTQNSGKCFSLNTPGKPPAPCALKCNKVPVPCIT